MIRIHLWVVASICGFLDRGALSEYNSYSGYNKEIYQKPYISDYSKIYPGYPYNYQYSTEKNLPTPNSKTEYGLHTVQTGTAYIHPGQKIPTTLNDKKTQYYFVTTNTTTFYLPGKSNNPRETHHHNKTNAQQQNHQVHHRRRNPSSCIKCPAEKIMIARKGLDGVLVEPPKLMSCHNRAIISDSYQIETLFGPSFRFLLPHGTHSIHAKIRNKRTGKHLQTCILRYKVIVQQCGRFFPRDENMNVNCDTGYIWGSKCHLTCRIGYLSHDRPMVCGDSLRWEGDEPECSKYPPLRSSSCDFLGIPDNGKFACEYPKGINSENYENELTTPEGTICRVICDALYEIPTYLKSYGTLRCENGRWNVTAQELCQLRNNYKYYN